MAVLLLLALLAVEGYFVWTANEALAEVRSDMRRQIDNLQLHHDTHVEDMEEELSDLHERIDQAQEEYDEAIEKQREAARRDVGALSGGLRSLAKRVRRQEERIEPVLQREAERGCMEYTVVLSDAEEDLLEAMSGKPKNASTEEAAAKRRAQYRNVRKHGFNPRVARRLVGVSERTGQRYEAWLRKTGEVE